MHFFKNSSQIQNESNCKVKKNIILIQKTSEISILRYLQIENQSINQIDFENLIKIQNKIYITQASQGITKLKNSLQNARSSQSPNKLFENIAGKYPEDQFL
ncbi:hypothetical protein ABPG72_008566 [Tetrahymena utriculariae]